MAQPTPPPYVGITGLYVEDPKHVDTNFAGYDGNASPGQLVVDTATYDLYIGNSLGNLNLVGGSGGTTWKTLGDKTTGVNAPTEIALGAGAGTGTVQGYGAIAFGENAGSTAQGSLSVAIGSSAGSTNQKDYTVAIGTNAGSATQGINSVAIGRNAGSTSQGANAVAIGRNAGSTSQGANSIAIGNSAGSATQAPNSIVLNATGTAVGTTVPNTFIVQPIRSDTMTNIMTAGGQPLYWIPSTGEIVAFNGM